MSQAEKFALLLERMELSKGFLNLEKKTYRPHYSKTSLLLPKDVMKKLFQIEPGNLSLMINNRLEIKPAKFHRAHYHNYKNESMIAAPYGDKYDDLA